MIVQSNRFRDRWISRLALAAALLSLTPATTALAAANTKGLVAIALQGLGTGALAAGDCTSPAIVCAPGDTCECFTAAETVLGNQGFNKGSLVYGLSVDTSTGALPISDAGSCRPAGGSGTIASSNGKSSISIDITGLVCPSADGSARTFNGTYSVTSGTKFTGGTGTINSSLVGTVSRSLVSGNVQP